jgi:hypothetical protein
MVKWVHAQALVRLRMPILPSRGACAWILAGRGVHLNQDRPVAERKNG